MSSDIPTPDEKRSIETSASEEIIGQLDAKLLALGLSDDDAYRKVLRRVDLRIMPLVLLQYLFMRVDVTNISNAAIMNLEQKTDIKTQLHLSAQQWVWVVACFYYPCNTAASSRSTFIRPKLLHADMFLEPISTILLKKTSAPVWLSRIMVSWGIVTACIAATTSYGVLITTRVLVGALEAGYFPCIYVEMHLNELAIRVAALYSMASLSGFISGFLAYAISYADGVLSGWQWLFILEGIPPVLIGILTFFVLPSYPEKSNWLSAEEKELILKHLHKDAPTIHGKTFDWHATRLLFTDPTFYSFTAAWICAGVGGSGISFSLPTVIKDLGFTDSRMANVRTMPPSFTAFALVLVLGRLVQTGKINPFPVVIILDLVIIACYIVLLYVNKVGVRYFVLVVSTGASGSLYPMLWPKRVQALRGTAMAGLGIGLHNASAQFSGILGPQIFSPAYGPAYKVSFKVSIALLAGAVFFHSLVWFFMHAPIQKYVPSLAQRVQAQTQLRKGDLHEKRNVGSAV
ncbi:MFS general substrate transporter [Mycena albidolilacea]|uniref:MFS general substrate transporter n=1 Tax=Mycena albidolilacea TaxID=1033008 RepID=A0AAD7AMH4_9AGAR|nr:MFS general substrate transporter [Mycena albidolilacea]